MQPLDNQACDLGKRVRAADAALAMANAEIAYHVARAQWRKLREAGKSGTQDYRDAGDNVEHALHMRDMAKAALDKALQYVINELAPEDD